MNLYQFDCDLQIIEKGSCDCSSALLLFEECYTNGLNSYDSGEEAMAATSLGLSRSSSDFVEISCNGNESISAHSDRLCYSSWISKYFGLNRHLFIKGNKAYGREVIQSFFNLDRQEFESKYVDFLCR
jgi:hypothetical protein